MMSPFQRNALLLAPALVVLVVWYQFVFSESGTEQVALEEQVQALSDKESFSAAQLRMALTFDKGGEKAKAELAALQSSLPRTDDVGEFIRQHEELANRLGVTIDSLAPDRSARPDGRVPPAGLAVKSVSIAVSGDPAAVTAYLDQLATLPRANVIEKVNLTNGSSTRAQAQLTLRLFSRLG